MLVVVGVLFCQNAFHKLQQGLVELCGINFVHDAPRFRNI